MARPHPPSGRIGPITPAERIVVDAEPEQRPVTVAPAPPVVPTIVPPIMIPPRDVARATLEAGRRLRPFARLTADYRHAVANDIRQRPPGLAKPAASAGVLDRPFAQDI